MKIIETNSYEEMSVIAAGIIGAQVLLKQNSVLGLATGATPIGAYKELIKNYNQGILDFSEVKTFNLDEYRGLNGEDSQSYRYFMDKNLFEHINISKENTFLPNGTAENGEEECKRYEKLIGDSAKMDLQLLGIGQNGHIGFNEPADYFSAVVHEVKLAESTIQANARLFDDISQVPTFAFTMGIGTIMKARKILLIAGADKKKIIEKSLFGKVTPEVPASVLQLHSDVTVVISKN
jgi:glucosamine-6-phosphate isomerase